MKIYKFITQISIAGCMLVGTPMLQGCMDNSLNDPLGKVSEEELGRDGFAANAFFLTLCDYAYPIATENIYNTNESLIGDCYGRYQVMATDKFKGANFATYNAPENWLNWQFADDNVMVLTYGAWNKIKNVTQGTGVNFAWAQILRIATMHRMLDMYGALPYSQISSDKLSAPYDTMEEAYHAMFTDLTDAINVMTVYVTENPNNRTMAKYDKVYDGDFEKWVKFANSLKLRMAIRIRFADREYARQMAEEAINHSIGVITSNEDNATSLGTKNQLYTVLVQWPDQCVSADITSYMKGYNDPRMSKYFKKKTSDKGDDDYVGMRAGLSYGNDITGPTFSRINVGEMDRTLWMSAAETAFNKAEAAMLGWDVKGETVKDLYESAIRLSFAQWGVSDGIDQYLNDESSTQADYVDPNENKGNESAISSITIKWKDNAGEEEKLERLITQKWIAMWPLGQEAWSEYRRTGYPRFFPLLNGNVTNLPSANRIPFPPSEYIRNAANVNAGLLLLLPLFSGCNDSDDVAAIFTGKTWKLNYITVDGGHEMFGFWENEEQEKASIKELNKNGTYNIVFDGTVDGDVINGNIKGTVIATSTFEGKWNANAKNNSFKATVTTAGSYGDDKLAKNFIEGLNAATSYEGDSNNLYLLYKPASGKQTFRMVFRVVSSK